MKTVTTLATLAFAAQLAAGAAQAATQAGVSAAVRGQVDLTPVVDQAVRPIGSGEDVFLGDALKSHEQSGMQLMLLDETSITLGPNADLTVDEFVYDPATGIGEVTASLATGVFRFVTGKTSQGPDKAMTLKVPFGVIGVRGTMGAVKNDAAGSLIVLLGPGSENNADERSGALDVTAQGTTVSLIRPRFGTFIAPGQPPSDPFELDDAQLASILGPIAPPPLLPPDLPPSVRDAVIAAQQDIAMADGDSALADTISDLCSPPLSCDLTDTTELAEGIIPPTGFGDLPIQGQFEFENKVFFGNPVALSGGPGNFYEFSLDVDFGSRTIGSPLSNVEIFSTQLNLIDAPSNLPTLSFDDTLISGFPVFNFPTQVINPLGSNCPCDVDVGAIIVNSGQNIDHALTITNGSITQTGSGTTVAHPVPWTQVCLTRRA